MRAVEERAWFTSTEAAEFLDLSVDLVNDLVDKGKLEGAWRTSIDRGHRRIPKETAEAYRKRLHKEGLNTNGQNAPTSEARQA